MEVGLAGQGGGNRNHTKQRFQAVGGGESGRQVQPALIHHQGELCFHTCLVTSTPPGPARLALKSPRPDTKPPRPDPPTTSLTVEP